jgi:hypothetical protein
VGPRVGLDAVVERKIPNLDHPTRSTELCSSVFAPSQPYRFHYLNNTSKLTYKLHGLSFHNILNWDSNRILNGRSFS